MAGDDLELRVAWQHHVDASPTGQHWFDVLIARHGEPHRRYHGVRHVRWVVRHVLDLARRLESRHVALDDLSAVVAAAFFHDAVYDPTRNDNERASGRLAARALADLGWPSERVASVVAMIEATAAHADDSRPDSGRGSRLDTAVLLAADLGVLASEPARYADYVRGVRDEYARVDDAGWRSGRTAVLRGLLARDRLFAPELGLTDWEQRARANITAELAALDRPSDDRPASRESQARRRT